MGHAALELAVLAQELGDLAPGFALNQLAVGEDLDSGVIEHHTVVRIRLKPSYRAPHKSGCRLLI